VSREQRAESREERKEKRREKREEKKEQRKDKMGKKGGLFCHGLMKKVIITLESLYTFPRCPIYRNGLSVTAVQFTPSVEYVILLCVPTATNLPPP